MEKPAQKPEGEAVAKSPSLLAAAALFAAGLMVAAMLIRSNYADGRDTAYLAARILAAASLLGLVYVLVANRSEIVRERQDAPIPWPTLWMLWILDQVRTQRASTFRRFPGGMPHYVKDLLSLLKAINVLAIIPGMIAPILTPRHFGRRLDRIVAGKIRHYRTPIATLLTATIVCGLLKYVDVYEKAFGSKDSSRLISQYPILSLLAATALLPVVLYAFSFTFVIFRRVALLFCPCKAKYGVANIICDMGTYEAINWKRFGWSLFYLAPLALFFVPLLVIFLRHTGQAAYLMLEDLPGFSGLRLVALFLCFYLGQLFDTLLPWYAELLRACGPTDTPRMLQFDLRPLRETLVSVTTSLKLGSESALSENLDSAERHLAGTTRRLQTIAFDHGRRGPAEKIRCEAEIRRCLRSLPASSLLLLARWRPPDPKSRARISALAASIKSLRGNESYVRPIKRA